MKFILFTAFLLTAGCIKAKELKEDLGPEVSAESIDLALSKAIGDANLNDLHVGQFVEYITTQRLENEESAMATAGSRAEIIKREETDAAFKYTIRIVRSDRTSNGNWETRVTEEPLSINKPSLIEVVEGSARQNVVLAKALATQLAEFQADNRRVTFHNLRESSGTIDPPARVRMRADCGGLSPCEIPVNYIRFDMVAWNSDSDYQKVALDFAFSLKPPFLPHGADFEQLSGIMLIDCRSTYIPVENRTVYVRSCKSLEDFQK